MLGQPHWWLRPQGTARTERRRSELRVRPFSLAATDACFDCGAFASGPRSMPRLRPVSGHAWDVARLVPGALSVSGRPLDSSLLSVPVPSRRCPVVAESLSSSQGACPASLSTWATSSPIPPVKRRSLPFCNLVSKKNWILWRKERQSVFHLRLSRLRPALPGQGGGVTAWEPRARRQPLRGSAGAAQHAGRALSGRPQLPAHCPLVCRSLRPVAELGGSSRGSSRTKQVV